MAFRVWLLALSLMFSRVTPGGSTHQCFIPLYGQILFYHIAVSHFVYPFVN